MSSHDSEQIPPVTPSHLEQTLPAVCEAAVNLVGVDHSGLVLFDQNRQQGIVVAEYPPRDVSAIGRHIQISGVPLEERLANQGEPIIVNDVESDSYLGPVKDILLALGIKSIVVVPITVDGEIKGSFSFDSTEEKRVFEEDDIRKCRNLAEFASIVVKNAYFVNNLEALRQAMLAIASEQEREPLLQTIIVQAVNLLGAKGGGIYEYDNLRKELDVVAAYNPPTDIMGKTLKIEEGMAGHLIKSDDKFIAIPSYRKSKYRAEIYDQENTFGSVLGVPLSWQGERSGVLWVDAEEGRNFGPSEIDLLRRLADTASIAFEQSRLRERASYKVERLQRLAAATNDIVSKLGTGGRESRLTLIARYAHEILNSEACGVHLVEQPGWLTWMANHGNRPGGFEKGRKFKIQSGRHTGLTGHIAFEGRVFSACGDELTTQRAVKSTEDNSPTGICHSLLAIPLKTEGGELRGLIRISNKIGKDGRPHPWTCFTDDDRAITEIFAQAAMIEIETADLLDEIKKGERRYKTLLDACRIIVQAKSLEVGLAELAQIIMTLLDKSFCRILLADESGEWLTITAAAKRERKENEFKWNPRVGEKTRISDWENLAQSLETGKHKILHYNGQDGTANLEHLSEWIQLKDDKDKPLKVRSMLTIPLKVGAKELGLLNVGELRARTSFTGKDVEQGVAISSQVSALIERLERDKKFLYDLFKTESEINASNDLETTLKLVSAQVFDVANRYGRNVNVVDINIRRDNKIKVIAAYPEDRLPAIRKIIGKEFDLEKNDLIGIVGRVILTGEPINEGNVLTNPDYLPIHDDTRSQLVVPIKDGSGTTIGAISVETSEVEAFDQQDLIVVQGLASQASSAIVKNRQSRENKKVRTVALVGAAGSIWKHDFKNAAGIIMGEVDNALNNLSNPGKVSSSLAVIREKAQSIENFPFTGPLAGDKGISEELLNTMIEERLNRLYGFMRRQGIRADVRKDLTATENRRVRINKKWFQYALKMFLVNTREAITSASLKMIDVRTEMLNESYCRILIKNSGAKIADEIWEKLGTDQIERSDGNRERGVGLLIADLILAVYGGRLEKITNEGNNIVFGVILPVL